MRRTVYCRHITTSWNTCVVCPSRYVSPIPNTKKSVPKLTENGSRSIPMCCRSRMSFTQRFVQNASSVVENVRLRPCAHVAYSTSRYVAWTLIPLIHWVSTWKPRAFWLLCALEESPLTNEAEGVESSANFALTVKEGRRPRLLLHKNGEAISLQAWGLALLEKIIPVAALLDKQRGGDDCAKSMQVQKDKLLNSELTPSAQVLKAIQAENGSFTQFALKQSSLLAAQFRARPLDAQDQAYFEQLAQVSIAEQAEMEASQSGTFEEFITDYRSRTSSQICCDN